MARTMILVSDDRDLIQSTRAYAESRGVTLKVYSSYEWSQGLNNPSFVQTLGSGSLSYGANPVSDGGAKILPFPGSTMPTATAASAPVGVKRVQTINELESEAIENAIHSFNGNLTEAAKALGIGRATLYRKVKQYNIDPNFARKKRAA